MVDVGMRLFGLPRVVRLARPARRPRGSSEADIIHATVHNVLTATALYPGRSKCLEQSVAVYILLRRRGYDARLRIGVQPYPFAAHAWLELNGVPLTETAEAVSRFAVMPEPTT
jgi:hypothetical protein